MKLSNRHSFSAYNLPEKLVSVQRGSLCREAGYSGVTHAAAKPHFKAKRAYQHTPINFFVVFKSLLYGLLWVKYQKFLNVTHFSTYNLHPTTIKIMLLLEFGLKLLNNNYHSLQTKKVTFAEAYYNQIFH